MNLLRRQKADTTQSVRDSVPVLAAVGLLVVASAIPYTSYLPFGLAYGSVVLAYAVLVGTALIRTRETLLVAPKWAVALIGTIWTIYLGHLFAAVATGSVTFDLFIRVPAFVLLTGINVFYVPRLVSRGAFFGILARVAAALVLIGLPTLFVDSYTLGIVEVTSIRTETVPFLSIERPAPNSIFQNKNVMSYVAMVGFLSACGERLETGQATAALLVAINGVGLYLAHARASMLGAAAGLVLFVAYTSLSDRAAHAVAISGGLAFVYAVCVIVGVLPGPAVLTNVDMHGRAAIWQGGVRSVATRPLFGFGPGDTGQIIAPFVTSPFAGYDPHNSYLRVFIDTGIVGGCAYLVFVVKTLFAQLTSVRDAYDLATLALCSGVAITMVFEGYTLFGISIMSLTGAIAFGYGVKAGASPVGDPSPEADDRT
ncbi:O-antigen ligase family protein [Halomicrobium salinisoli]|uniref:O-antigen ligase family protein n=1 Tax=Halomicrobium salinisoli TaxID=2878391 RepID=UPI001CEFF5D1|nr:O-antigen ligase family protein [Halomicrobium salinisoli]